MLDLEADYRSLIRSRLKYGDARRLAAHLNRAESWVSMMLRGGKRSLPPDLAGDVADFFQLEGQEREHFIALVELEEGNTESARRKARSILRSHGIMGTPQQRVNEAIKLFAEGWYIGAVLELARCDKFEPSPQWIAPALNPSITTTQASRALVLLIRNGLLQEDGRISERERMDISTPLDMPATLSEAGHTLHRESMMLAADAAGRFYPNERHLGAGFVALSEKRFDEIRNAFRETFLHAIAETTVDEAPPNRVYQFVVALHPVSNYSDSQ
ncbi:MAG: TIGR02147 family protein [Myxococcota bacterium]